MHATSLGLLERSFLASSPFLVGHCYIEAVWDLPIWHLAPVILLDLLLLTWCHSQQGLRDIRVIIMDQAAV